MIPNRMAFLYVPNGKIMEKWTPTGVGTDYELTNILQPLANVKGKNVGSQRIDS